MLRRMDVEEDGVVDERVSRRRGSPGREALEEERRRGGECVEEERMLRKKGCHRGEGVMEERVSRKEGIQK